ncbi:ribosome maturation factor RimM [Marinicella litoralis]|uniref:Ribosome maturation factor RimM n=1 Tax=Marinicella litoralis TaxID=644220 RepID=A0A4R6XP15_9GAMM|nr:ribosome maturation factor RimM [Marinicella litoralis]TDR19487.1 16S rRNA processing protein RimM [Marinicella litoralis]
MAEDLITVGKITGHYGVKGWLKVFSYTQPMENIANYAHWYVGGELIKGIKAKKHGKTMVAYFKGMDNRECSQKYIGLEVEISAKELGQLPENEYYWMQLIGLEVSDLDGRVLGVLDSMFETGANDVIVLKDAEGTEHLIPYILGGTVIQVDLVNNTMTVDWQIEGD